MCIDISKSIVSFVESLTTVGEIEYTILYIHTFVPICFCYFFSCYLTLPTFIIKVCLTFLRVVEFVHSMFVCMYFFIAVVQIHL